MYIIYLCIILLLVVSLVAFYNFIIQYRIKKVSKNLSEFEEDLTDVNLLIVIRNSKTKSWSIHCNKKFISLDDNQKLIVTKKLSSIEYLDINLIINKLILTYGVKFKVIYVFGTK